MEECILRTSESRVLMRIFGPKLIKLQEDGEIYITIMSIIFTYKILLGW
jgi:hypothetical protein